MALKAKCFNSESMLDNINFFFSRFDLFKYFYIYDIYIKAKLKVIIFFVVAEDALRIIEAGGFYLNYRKIANYNEMIVPGIHILPNKISLARVGKKNYYVIRWSP